MSRPVRVLLLWPGTDGAAAGNFGVPQLVLMATYARAQTGAEIEIRDLVAERYLGPVDVDALFAGEDGEGYDVVAFSIYSSFDHLKCEALAEMARARLPNAVIACGGYHASARPLEYVREGSVFDVCVVGEGEKPLVEIIESVSGGAPLRNAVLGPQAIDDLDSLPRSDWSFLERYRPVARRMASQAQVYLSRGCPFDCAFCMERAKREVSWRPLSVDRAVEEITSLHDFLDLRGWTLYFGDALFGMRRKWRREFLERLARADVPVDKYWLLIRVDLVDDEDLRLFGEANCGLGFGLESGDPELLATIRKSGRLDDYLQRMEHIADRARVHDVPWGANVICGHPGETPDSMRRSAAYLRRLFLEGPGTTGFLSVDPFRLYPGSPIDADRGHYEQTYGTRFHRPHWWDDGDPEFLSEWVDPSSELSYRERERLQDELLTPVLLGIEDKFVYGGSAREYFLRAIRDQVAHTRSRSRMHYLDRWYAWQRYLGQGEQAAAYRDRDDVLARIASELRRERLAKVCSTAGIDEGNPIAEALAEVPRERFVPVDAIGESTKDVPIALDSSGAATVSAMHAYARTFSLLGVADGDRVLDLGAGTGYGCAVLRRLVGPRGTIVGLEVDGALVNTANAALDSTVCHTADALDPSTWPCDPKAFAKVSVGFAVDSIPDAWVEAFEPGTVIVAPLRDDAGELRITRLTHDGRHFEREPFEAVRYVPARRPADIRVVTPEPVRLNVVRG